MRPQAEARVIRSTEVEPTSFGPLAEYRRLTGQDGSPIFTGVQTCAPGYATPMHWHPYVECLFVLEGTMEAFLEGQGGHALPARARRHDHAAGVHAARVSHIRRPDTAHPGDPCLADPDRQHHERPIRNSLILKYFSNLIRWHLRDTFDHDIAIHLGPHASGPNGMETDMCTTTFGTLTLATMLTDPLIQAMMRSDRVSERDYAALLFRVKDTLVARDRPSQPVPELAQA